MWEKLLNYLRPHEIEQLFKMFADRREESMEAVGGGSYDHLTEGSIFHRLCKDLSELHENLDGESLEERYQETAN